MILWKFTLREVKSRPGRATLTLLSIIIGVAAVVAVTVSTATTHQASQEMYTSMAGRAALEVAAEGNGFFSEDVAEEIGKLPGVKAAIPTVQNLSALRYEDKKVRLQAMGVDPTRDEAVRDYELAEGRFFADKYEALLETGFARGLGVKLGDEVRLASMRAGVKPLKIVGLLSPRGAAGFNQGGIIFLPIKTAAFMFNKAGNINNISVVLHETADEPAVSKAIRDLLPAGLSVRSPMARAQVSRETVQKVETGLAVSNAMMLVLAFFTIFNTFLMNVGERRRQLAVLRAIGTTRRQIIRMLLLEGVAMGVVGTLLGIAAGLGGALLLARSMGQIYSTTIPSLCITPKPFVLAAILGPSVSMLAMFVPAWIAGRVSPLEGMRFIASEGYRRVSASYILFAITVFLTTGGAMAACITGYLPVGWMIICGVAFTVAFLALVPILLSGLAWLVATVLYPFLRTEGRIAHRQILRRRVRTTLTIGILYIAVSMAVSQGTLILDTVNEIHTWIEKTLKGDFFVRVMMQDQSTGESPKMPESLVNDLRGIEGVSNVDSIRYISGSIRVAGGENTQRATIFVRDFTDKGVLPLMIKDGDPATLREHLAQGEVVLGTVLANRIGAKVGEEITLETREGPKQLRVAATTVAYMVGGMVVYMEGDTAKKLLNADGVDMYIVNTAPGALAAVEAKLRPICDESGLMLHSFAELRQRIDELTRGLIAGLWGLLVLGLVIGGFAIANTLTMNVLEQTRELALLRVVAMTRWQVRKTIFAQAIIIGCIGLGTGVTGGIIGAYVTNLSSVPMLGHAPQFALHPSLMLVCFGIGMLVILAAAWLPAERAARLNLLIALQYE